MNQFKDVFLGTGDRPYERAVNTQKCLRVSGKHNDLEEVGLDTYHHTFFEMLGNWSFGDYFKRDAIRWAWELMVYHWKLDPDRLYVTVHMGDERLGLEPDNEAADLWMTETNIDPDHVIFGSSKDNFWMMGDTGPCGPCSEIHIDLRPDEERQGGSGKELVNADHPSMIEIWNLVFIQYNAQLDGTLEPLKSRHVDTGMGFERLVAVLQGKTSNYDTDLFQPLLQKMADLSPRVEIHGYDAIDVDNEHEKERLRIAMRVIADHIRTIAFAVADGVTPGNVGRSYVIRRILRRGVRFGYQTLEMREPFMYRLVDPLQKKMGEHFSELTEQQDHIERVIKAEEENFLQTLGTGIEFLERVTPYVQEIAALEEQEGDLDEVLTRLRADRQTMDLLGNAYEEEDRDSIFDAFTQAASKQNVPGEVAFLLHDTYGFPIDLTQLMAREAGLDVDMERYEVRMKQQRDRARAATTFKVDQSQLDEWRTIGLGDDSVFVGYEKTEVDAARVMAVRMVEDKDGSHRHEIVLDQTPFYAESGGQIGDVGILEIGDERIKVLDTQKLQNRIVHYVDRFPEHLDAPVRAMVQSDRRRRIRKHHTATHLLHAALREILGTHVQQKGSLVAPDRLRFDFSHYDRVTPEELGIVQARVNEAIQRNISRQEERDVPVDEAMSRGAMALFGEKYGDRVRVITFDPDYSVELCGGTHVDYTGEIGLFQFLSEGSVAAGIRRVEAVAGEAALNLVDQEMGELELVREQFKGLQQPVSEAVHDVLEENRSLRKSLEEQKQKNLSAELDAFIKQAREVDGVRLVTGHVQPTSMDMLNTLGQSLRDRLGRGAVGVLGAVDPDGEKVYMVAGVSDDVIERGVKAGDLVGRLARHVGGGGGGRPTLATAGGRHPEKIDEALGAAEQVLTDLLS
jgi:alanyl-tRNA synthetase